MVCVIDGFFFFYLFGGGGGGEYLRIVSKVNQVIHSYTFINEDILLTRFVCVWGGGGHNNTARGEKSCISLINSQ